jgi:hypothetical protein
MAMSITACSNTDDMNDDGKKANATTSMLKGKDYVAQQGENFQYDNGKFVVSLNKVYSLEQTGDSSNKTLIALEMTTKNNSGSDRILSGLKNFTTTVDGNETGTPLSVLGLVDFNHYFGADMIINEETVKNGDTKTFIMPTEVPNNFETLTVSFKPYVNFSNDTVSFTIKKENCVKLPDNPEDFTYSKQTSAVTTLAE